MKLFLFLLPLVVNGFWFSPVVFQKKVVDFAGKKEDIIVGGKNLLPFVDQALEGIEQIGIIGWGPQASAQSKNLRDSLLNKKIVIGLRDNSSSKAEVEREGFEVKEIIETVKGSDLVLLLVSDAAQVLLHKDIFSAMKPKATLGLSHGFLIGYLESVGEQVPSHINVVGVCPKGMGPSVRKLFKKGKGINSSICVHQDINGKASDIAVAWAIAIGSPSIFVTDFISEYKSDLFGERGILLGAVHGLVESLFKRYTNTLRMPSQEAFRESAESITGAISPTISKQGILTLYNNLSLKDKEVFDRAYCLTYPVSRDLLEEIYDEVENGNEVRSIILHNKRLSKYPLGKIDETYLWKVAEDVRKTRNGKFNVNAFTAGMYIATMMAQIDILLERGHSYSEVVNESVIEAVDSLCPYLHEKGIAHMIDNCSTTARLGARKWAPRFDYIFEQQVYPKLDSGLIEFDRCQILNFVNHPIHECLSELKK